MKRAKEQAMRDQKRFNSTSEGQRAMCTRAGRLATLHLINETIRKVDPSEAYDRALIDRLTGNDAIDSLRDLLLADYNRIVAKK